MSQMYIHNDADVIFIYGDLNFNCRNVIATTLDASDIPESCNIIDMCNLYRSTSCQSRQLVSQRLQTSTEINYLNPDRNPDHPPKIMDRSLARDII